LIAALVVVPMFAAVNPVSTDLAALLTSLAGTLSI